MSNRGVLAGVMLAATICAVGGAVALGRGTNAGLSGAILLWVFAGALVAVGLEKIESRAEGGKLDLSARIGLGALGGALGALASLCLAWLTPAAGVTNLLRVALPAPSEPAAWSAWIWHGVLWGLAFGILYPRVPGRTFASRGFYFSLAPSLYLLLKVFPFDLGLGLFGEGLGSLTFLFVIFYSAVWGVTVASVLAWGARTNLAPVSRPLVE